MYAIKKTVLAPIADRSFRVVDETILNDRYHWQSEASFKIRQYANGCKTWVLPFAADKVKHNTNESIAIFPDGSRIEFKKIFTSN